MLEYSRSGYVYDNMAEVVKSFNIGDKVKIKSLKTVREVKEKGYDFPAHFNHTMERYCGKEAVIKATGSNTWGKCYYLDIDNGVWQWSIHMFELGGSKLMENE